MCESFLKYVIKNLNKNMVADVAPPYGVTKARSKNNVWLTYGLTSLKKKKKSTFLPFKCFRYLFYAKKVRYLIEYTGIELLLMNLVKQLS